ncbi:xanthine dehydrogenase accessory protein XdhC [Cohaesibacter celericrescens]|uniref:Xanthine dehydrogenase accessory protein XdhC n=1 Tax=Cohaesibacter celericrescens TaxID=2067669 RepID=A0A2N5XWC6_9HYPH|nr:xanthine dehydrogenase accessory protein XdhC [Cohaesibacter celericrescens]PLW78811.1 xanthine dehydrogenase accessory protein XdhC [Cohaesibacter celericrescens]
MRTSLKAFLNAHDRVYQVSLTHVKGSSPREVGATLYVATDALWGTIGGGQLEFMAIDEARRMQRDGTVTRDMTVPLGPEIGQCCGGVVTLRFSMLDAQAQALAKQQETKEIDARPAVYVFGAGHVGRALCAALALLPLRVCVIDSRADELALVAGDVEQRCSPLPEAEIRSAEPGCAYVILTHDHALDFLLVREALLRGDAAYVGMIGSKSKRATFSHWLKQEVGVDADAYLQNLTCPIGAGGSKDKRPAVVAAMVAAEVMTMFDVCPVLESTNPTDA